MEKNFSVISVDNLITGKVDNLSSFRHNPYFTFLNLDLNNSFPPKFQTLLKKTSYIFHLASPASPNQKNKLSYYHLPRETLLVNSCATDKLLASTLVSNAKFLFASSSEVYGDPQVHPQKEDYWGHVNPIGERSCYDEAKRFGEALTYTYFRKYKRDIRIIRIFNTYGPRMPNDGRVVAEFIQLALLNKPLPIFGTGKQTRSFCYVADLVEGIYRSMFYPRTNGQVINLGNPTEVTILALAKLIKKITNSKSDFVFEKLPVDDPLRRKPDITKAKTLLNWIPQVSLNEGLRKTINYFIALK